MAEEPVAPSGEPAQEPVVEPTGTEPTEPVVEPTEPPAEPAPPEPKKPTAQERINEITKARREAEREAAYWRKVALEKQGEPAPQIQTPPTSPRPKRDQFETEEAYEDALINFRLEERERATTEQRQRTEQEQAYAAYQKRAAAVRAEHEDFDIVTEEPVFTPAMKAAILHSENGPSIAYHLGLPENRELAERIGRMPAELQAYEVGKLETQILVAKQTKKTTTAPPPIKPVGMGGGDAGPADESKMTDAEWFKHYQDQKKQRLAKKYGG